MNRTRKTDSVLAMCLMTMVCCVSLGMGGCVSSEVLIKVPRNPTIANTSVKAVRILGMHPTETTVENAIRLQLRSLLTTDDLVSKATTTSEPLLQVTGEVTSTTQTDTRTGGLGVLLASSKKNQETGFTATRTYTLHGNYVLRTLDNPSIATGSFSPTIVEKSEGTTIDSAVQGLPSNEAKVQDLATKAADVIRRQAFPFIDRQKVTLKGGGGFMGIGGNKQFAFANDYLEAGENERARAIFTSIANQGDAKDQERGAALYNLGVLAEVESKNDIAKNYYNQTLQYLPADKDVLANLKRMRDQSK